MVDDIKEDDLNGRQPQQVDNNILYKSLYQNFEIQRSDNSEVK